MANRADLAPHRHIADPVHGRIELTKLETAVVDTPVFQRLRRVAQAMRERGVEPHEAAHFLMKVVFALFAEDIGLLRRGLLTEVLAGMVDDPDGLDDLDWDALLPDEPVAEVDESEPRILAAFPLSNGSPRG